MLAAIDRCKNFAHLGRCRPNSANSLPFAGAHALYQDRHGEKASDPLRGAIYHVMARGNRKERIFVDDVDRRRFLKIVVAALEKFGAECYAIA